MNNLLPNVYECEKIIGDWKTFSDCCFNKEYSQLSFEKQLQVINDIIRQTILVSDKPNPKTETNTLIGDSYTSSLVALEYLKKYNIGFNHRMVIANDIRNDEYIPTIHTLLLVDDVYGETYQFDCTPNIGYGFGKVKKLKEELFYDEYNVISNNIASLLYDTRLIINEINTNKLQSVQSQKLKEISFELKKFPFLIGYYNELNNIMINYEINVKKYDRWQEELKNLQFSNISLERQLELSQALTAELIKSDFTMNKYANINNTLIALNTINSRFFYENRLTLVLIKPSSYKLGITSSVKDKFLKKGKGAISKQFVNMGLSSELFNLPLMQCFHPHGYKYERAMNGPGEMFLIDENPLKTGIIKKEIRNSYGNIIKNHYVEWFDGQPILWDSIVTNLLHSTDDACETAVHFLSPYPEYQMMTRYMYPNPILQKVRK